MFDAKVVAATAPSARFIRRTSSGPTDDSLRDWWVENTLVESQTSAVKPSRATSDQVSKSSLPPRNGWSSILKSPV